MTEETETIEVELHLDSRGLNTLRQDVCAALQKRINDLKKPAAFDEPSRPKWFEIIWYDISIGVVHLDVRTQKGKLLEQHVLCRKLENGAYTSGWLDCQTAFGASYFLAGCAG